MSDPQRSAGLLVLGAFLFGAGMIVGQLSQEAWLAHIDESTRLELRAMAASTQTALDQVSQALRAIHADVRPPPPHPHGQPPSGRWGDRS